MFLSNKKQHHFCFSFFLFFTFLFSNSSGNDDFGFVGEYAVDYANQLNLGINSIVTTQAGMEKYYIEPYYGNPDSGSISTPAPEIDSNKQKLLYSHSPTLHQQVKQSIVDFFKGPTPELAKLLDTSDLINVYQSQIANLFGFDKYSVSDASAFLWLQAYLAINYKTDPPISKQQIKAVSEQFKIIAVNAKQHSLSNKDKQTYAEVLIHQGMLIFLGYEDAKKNNNQTALENIAKAARASVEGIEQYIITDQGFDRIKEKLSATGSPLADAFVTVDAMTINKYISEPKSGLKNLIAIKTATNEWFQCQGKNHCFAWDLNLSSLVSNPIQQLDGVIKIDIFDSLDLSAYSDLFPITVYIGRIDSNNQLHYGYFQVILL